MIISVSESSFSNTKPEDHAGSGSKEHGFEDADVIMRSRGIQRGSQLSNKPRFFTGHHIGRVTLDSNTIDVGVKHLRNRVGES